MQDLQTILLEAILGFNLIPTLIFMVLFIKKYLKIKSIASPSKQCRDRDFLLRTILNSLYVIISFTSLLTQICQWFQLNELIQLIIIMLWAVFFISSVTLTLHMSIVRMEVKKALSTSNLHQQLLTYLLIICMQQLTLCWFQIQINVKNKWTASHLISTSLAFCQVVNCLVILILWRRKKQMMSKFDDVINIEAKVVNDHFIRQSMLSSNTYVTNPNNHPAPRMSKQQWNLIVPTVLFELGKIRIILQAYASNNILNLLNEGETQPNTIAQENTRFQKKYSDIKVEEEQNQHLQIISDRQYTKQQIQKIYLTCSRFNNNNKIQFIHDSDKQYYGQVKKFINELFQINSIYIPQILQLFQIDQQWIKSICQKAKIVIKSHDQLLISTFIDYNAFFLSIQIFKLMYTYDHFIFYIHTITMDTKEKAVCWKRYSDFQDFHFKLQETIKNQIRSQYQLPALPKKSFFSLKESDQDKANERRKQLQKYCRETFNDYEIMTKFPATKQVILQFLQLKNVTNVMPNVRKALQFYQGLQVRKGKIYTALLGEQYVTFYQFLFYQNQNQIRTIKKRFSQFRTFDIALKKWMNNLQIVYKSVVLPQAHLYQSQSKRHGKLITYLEGVISIKGIYKLYTANAFFSQGEGRQMVPEEPNRVSIIKQESDIQQNEDNESRKGVMDDQSVSGLSTSLLIQQLGRQ